MKKFKETKFGKLLLNNLALKILAAVIAVILWLVVVNVDDPYRSRTIYGVNVVLENEDVLTNMGYTYNVTVKTIKVMVKAPQTVVDNLKSSDFVAVVDVTKRENNGDCPIEVECLNSEYKGQVSILSQQYARVNLNIENRVTKEYAINTENSYTGTPSDGYIVSEISTSPTTLTISGAETVMDQIDHVGFEPYDVSSMNQSITDSVVPVFYRADGSIIESDRIECSRSQVRLDITILPTKWVDVNFALTGELPDGYELSEYTSSPKSVRISGTKEELAKINSIDISAGGLDITGLKEDKEFNISLLTYLSGNYHIISETNMLKVNVKIKHVIDREIEIPFSSIVIAGLGSNLNAEITDGNRRSETDDAAEAEADEETEDAERTLPNTDSIIVTVHGEENTVNALTVEDLAPTLSATARGAGTYNIKLTLKSGDNYSILDEYYMTVVISRQTIEEPTTEAPSEEIPGETDSEEVTEETTEKEPETTQNVTTEENTTTAETAPDYGDDETVGPEEEY